MNLEDTNDVETLKGQIKALVANQQAMKAELFYYRKRDIVDALAKEKAGRLKINGNKSLTPNGKTPLK